MIALNRLFKILKYTIPVVAILLAFLFAYLYIQEKKEHKDTRTELDVKTQDVQILTDQTGKLYGRVLSYEKTNRELKKSHDSIEIKLRAQAQLNGLKQRQITKLQYALIETKDSLKSRLTDTINIIQGVMYDKHATFNGQYLTADIYIVGDSAEAELIYKYSTELYMINSYTKRKFFLWRWLGIKGTQQQFDFKCSDPNADIKVLRSINTNN